MQSWTPIRRGPVGPLARFVAVAGLVWLATPAAAQAHSRSTVVAIDYRVAIRSSPSGVRARVLDGDRSLRLTVDRHLTVLVLGYGAEPFLRFSRRGVEVNDRAPTAWSDRLARGAHPAVDTHASPSWRLARRGNSFSWHEHRLAPPLGNGQTARWAIPLLVDGKRAAVGGTARRVRRPSPWPWLALGGLFLIGGVALLRGRTPAAARLTAFALAWTAGAAAFASVVGVTLAGAVGRSEAAELGAAAALALIGSAALLLWKSGRQVVVGAIATLAVIEGLGLLDVFVHGVVISALPAVVARAAAALTVWSGLTALLLVVLDGVVWDADRARRAGVRA